MKKIFNLKSFWVVFILAFAVFLSVFLSASQKYQVQTNILIIPKSQISATNFPYILQNLQILAHRQESSKIALKTLDGSGMLRITVSDENASEAQILSKKATRDALNVFSAYYDIRKDLDFRIIETILIYSNFAKLTLSILESLCLALLLSFSAFFFSFTLFKEKNKQVSKDFLPNNLSWARGTQKDFTLPEIKKWLPEKKELEKKEVPFFTTSCKTAAAPNNLPIFTEAVEEEVSTFLLGNEKKIEEEKEPTPLVSKVAPIIKEATPEEVKERLNKLLSGKLS